MFLTFFGGKPVPPQVEKFTQVFHKTSSTMDTPPHLSRPAILCINCRAAKEGSLRRDRVFSVDCCVLFVAGRPQERRRQQRQQQRQLPMTAKATATTEVTADETATTQARDGDNSGNCNGDGNGHGNEVATTKAYLTITLTAGETALRLGNIFLSEKLGSKKSSMDSKKNQWKNF